MFTRNDPAFESVSQINTESYVHASGFLSRSVDKYELDPSNMYTQVSFPGRYYICFYQILSSPSTYWTLFVLRDECFAYQKCFLNVVGDGRIFRKWKPGYYVFFILSIKNIQIYLQAYIYCIHLLQGVYEDDPFSVIIERPPSRNSNSSHGSSGFAASSVMTVYRAPNMSQNHGGESQQLLYKGNPRNHGPSPRDRKLSVIVDEEGNSRALDEKDHYRPPSYEYDFDTKVPDTFA